MPKEKMEINMVRIFTGIPRTPCQRILILYVGLRTSWEKNKSSDKKQDRRGENPTLSRLGIWDLLRWSRLSARLPAAGSSHSTVMPQFISV